MSRTSINPNPMSILNKDLIIEKTQNNSHQYLNIREKRDIIATNVTFLPINGTELPISTTESTENLSTEIPSSPKSNFSFEKRLNSTPTNSENEQKYPRFHVTYWMFYPYSQVNGPINV